YTDRIIKLLQPIIGEGKVNAQVSASLDFSSIESTREAYDPERSVIRSEHVSEQATRDISQALGIPGALSNQPPGAGTTDPAAAEQGDESAAIPSNQNRSSTRNFEVDRLISHTTNPRGTIQRLSVAVVIDSKTQLKDDGSIEKVAYADDEIKRFESLIKEAIGFDENRGDSVSVINTEFVSVDQEVTEIPMWQSLLGESWIMDLAKQIFGAIGLLIVYLVFGRPFLRSLNPNRVELDKQNIDPATATGQALPGTGSEAGQIAGEAPQANADGSLALVEDPNSAVALIRRSDATHEQKVEMARTLVVDDTARVANVIKQWVEED
ncbi:MAG: hypothetical protein KAU21_07460, partial [Gammaproteobacteria bacterium]|nr:hypothetical protein [Gammaproteobacteria bacterium]